MLFGIQKHDMDFLLFQMTHIFHVIIRNLIRLCKSHRLCAYLLLPNPPGKLSDAQKLDSFYRTYSTDGLQLFQRAVQKACKSISRAFCDRMASASSKRRAFTAAGSYDDC